MIRLVFAAARAADRARRRRRARARRPEARRRSATSASYKAKVQDGPWPAFPADLTSIAVALATQCEGSVLIHEKMFENRLFFTDKLELDGRGHHDLRPAPGDRHRPAPAARRAAVVARHPRRHGDADRRAVRDGRERDPQHPRDRPRLRAHRRAPARPRRADRAGRDRAARQPARSADPPDPQRHARRPARTRCASCARSPRRCAPSSSARLRRGLRRRRSSTRRRWRAATAVARRPRTGVRRARRGPRAALGHDGPDRAARRDALRDGAIRRCASATSPTPTARVRPQRGQPREFLQAGIELVGAPGAGRHRRGADGAVRGARRGRAGRATAIGLGDASLYPALLDGVRRARRARGRGSCTSSSRATSSGWSARSASSGCADEAAELLVRVPQLRGGPDVLAGVGGAGRRRASRACARARAARARGRRAGDLRPRPRPRRWATTRARSSRSTTRRSARRSAAAAATTTCSGASAARCPPSASRWASSGCTPR